MKWRIVLFFVAVVYLQLSDAEGNKIFGKDLPSQYQPMYLIPGTTDFWPYNEEGYLLFENRKTIELYCKKQFRYPATTETKLTLTYIGGGKLKTNSDNKQYTLREIKCKNEMEVEAKEQGTTREGYKLVNIGYRVGGKFKPIYQLCFDYQKMVAKYVKYSLLPGVLGRKKVTQKGFKDIISFGPYSFERFYNQIRKEFDRGHLAPDGDFFYGVEQIATYVYPNVAPQSKSLNSNDWSKMEQLIRSNQYNRIFDCYSGVLGVLPFGGVTEFYLDKTNNKIPAPKLFFKIVYEPKTKRAVVFVGVNDRFGNKRPDPICTNIIGQLAGITFSRPNNVYFYACEYDDFRKKSDLNYLPDLTVTEFLFKDKMSIKVF